MALVRAVCLLALAWGAFEMGWKCWLYHKKHPYQLGGVACGVLYVLFVLVSAFLAFRGVYQFFPAS